MRHCNHIYYLCHRFLIYHNHVKKLALSLRNGDENAVDIEIDATHRKNPLLDELEIIAEAITFLLKDKKDFTSSEKRKLSHVRNMTRHHKSSND